MGCELPNVIIELLPSGPNEHRQRQIRQVERLIEEFSIQQNDLAAYLAEQLLSQLRNNL